jgi:hypothetical protein
MTDDKKSINPDQPKEEKVEKKDAPKEEKEKLDADPNVKKSMEGLDDKLKEPGGLEVEEMPESGELQERRKQTSDKLQEMVPEDEVEAAFEDDGGLIDLLKESNLSPKHFKFCCGGIFVVLILGGLVWGGISLLPNLGEIFGGDDDEVVDEVDEVVVDDAEVVDGEFDYDGFEEEYGFLDPSVYIGVLIGEEVAEIDPATGTGEELGEELIAEGTLAPLIVDFANMYEAMQVDVIELLDASNERAEVLEDYQNELGFLLYTGERNLEELEQSNVYITEEYNELEVERDENEARFFTKMRELDSYGSVAALNDFIADAEEVVALRAEYQAREKLISYYEEVLVAMEARVADIEYNEEALVKGVQVVDISGSDIDLIIDESEL